MAEPTETRQKLELGLKPFIKPREQVNYIRRVLALHLGTETQSVPLKEPLSLIETPAEARFGESSLGKGIHKEYLAAVKSHVAARREFEAVLRANDTTGSPDPLTAKDSDGLAEHIDLLSLRQKHERLVKVQEHLESLVQKPACSPDFLDPTSVYQEAAHLPKVPDIVVNSLATEKTDSGSDIKDKVRQMERTALKAKLLLEKQELALQDAKAQGKRNASTVSHAERLNALNATRNELISWMEGELSNASSNDVEGTPGSVQTRHGLKGDQNTITTRLANIREKYDTYLQMRRKILEATARRAHPSVQLAAKPGEAESRWEPNEASAEYLLTPYIEELLSAAKDLKMDIGHKSHMASIVKQRNKDTQQALHHLAEESQLLPAHSSQDSGRAKGLMQSEVTAVLNDSQGLTPRIQPWVAAADTAKVAQLESVTETIEEGQAALENLMMSLEAIHQLLGQENPEPSDAAVTTAPGGDDEDDLWLNDGTHRHAKATKSSEKGQQGPDNGIWSKLQGNLGLIGHDELS